MTVAMAGVTARLWLAYITADVGGATADVAVMTAQATTMTEKKTGMTAGMPNKT